MYGVVAGFGIGLLVAAIVIAVDAALISRFGMRTTYRGVLTQTQAGTKVTRYRGIRAPQLSEALLECQGRVPNTRLLDAAVKARAEGLLTTAEWNRVRKERAA